MFQSHRHPHHEFFIVDEVFSQVAVQQIDSSFEVFFFAGDVRTADLVKDRPARSTDRTGDVIAWFDSLHIWSDFFDDSKRLVSDDKEVVSWRRVSIQGVVDFAVGCVHADFQCLNKDSPAVRDIGDRWFFQISEVNTVRSAWLDRNCLHESGLFCCRNTVSVVIRNTARHGGGDSTARVTANQSRGHRETNSAEHQHSLNGPLTKSCSAGVKSGLD